MGRDRAAETTIYAIWQMYAWVDGVRFGPCDLPIGQ
jgi:hypothetical protein